MNISLALSGGGFRASAFSHGAFLLLHELDLEKSINIISSVSGGTIAATLYSLYGNDFVDFSKRLDDVHERDDLLERATEVLSRGEVSVPSKRNNIITAFAEVYSQDLFEERKFGDLWEGGNGISEQLEDVIFNSTEFKTGTGFRFQKTLSPKAKIGNGNISISKDSAKQIRIGDILAASSCFSAGFEPLSLPMDFNLTNCIKNEISCKIESQTNADEIALMDGGIYDNQGIESVLLANERRKENEQSDLMIVVDVASADQDIYDPPKFIKRRWLWAIPVRRLMWLTVLLGLGVWVPPLISFYFNYSVIQQFGETINSAIGNRLMNGITIGYLSVYGVTSIALIYVLIRLLVLRRNLKKSLPVTFKYGMKILKSRTIGQFIDMLKGRVGSVVSLASQIFLKRGRSQVYEDAMEHEFLGEKTTAAILKQFSKYEANKISYDMQVPKELHLDLDDEKHKSMLSTCIDASTMPTTLWFKNNKDKKNKLVAAGSIILCYSLIKHIHRKKELAGWEEDVKKNSLVLWKQLVANPYCLVAKNNISINGPIQTQ